MSVYNKNGIELPNVYGLDGTALTAAYNLNGEELLGTPLKVMSFNVQKWDNINTDQILTDIFDTYNVDVVGFQEYATTKNAFLENWWDYDAVSEYTGAQYNAVWSKTVLNDTSTVFYATQTGEQRCYVKSHITVNGKTIAIYSTHLYYSRDADTSANATRTAQAEELIADMQTEEYAILTMDSNANVLNYTDGAWTTFGKMFADAGFNMANWSNSNFLYTCADNVAATIWETVDNIITTSNISIKTVTVDQIKVEQAAGRFIDHLPLIADLVVY